MWKLYEEQVAVVYTDAYGKSTVGLNYDAGCDGREEWTGRGICLNTDRGIRGTKVLGNLESMRKSGYVDNCDDFDVVWRQLDISIQRLWVASNTWSQGRDEYGFIWLI